MSATDFRKMIEVDEDVLVTVEVSDGKTTLVGLTDPQDSVGAPLDKDQLREFIRVLLEAYTVVST